MKTTSSVNPLQTPGKAALKTAGGPALELLKIGDFARLANTNLRTLRYYEELGLMEPASRSEGGFRYYRRTDLNRLNMIRSLQELGLHLDRIRELLLRRSSFSERQSFVNGVRQALQEQDTLLEKRIGELQQQRQKIEQAARKLEDCAQCLHHPCAVASGATPKYTHSATAPRSSAPAPTPAPKANRPCWFPAQWPWSSPG